MVENMYKYAWIILGTVATGVQKCYKKSSKKRQQLKNTMDMEMYMLDHAEI
jgi:hypothetical protein